MNKKNLVIFCSALLSVAPLARAGQDSANRVALNVPGMSTSMEPPPGFNPINASDAELATYGFPPRPDAQASPKSYAIWQKAMTASQKRIVPEVEVTNNFAGPNRKAASSGEKATYYGESYNWSGAVDFSGATSYNNSSTFYFILADWVVPVARQAYGACNGLWDYEVSWVGIDGDGSGDVLQAGTQSDAYCSGGSTSTYYGAWFEWFPNGWTNISNFPVAPGDDMFVEVWHTSPTQGYAYLVNYQTDQWVEIGFTAPHGTSLVGNSAEWVVERPGVYYGLADLTNYIDDVFWDCYAYTENYTEYYPGLPSSVLLTMLDNSSHAISYPTLLGSNAILFQDEGSAR